MGELTARASVLAIGSSASRATGACLGRHLEKVKNSLVDPDEWTAEHLESSAASASAVRGVLGAVRASAQPGVVPSAVPKLRALSEEPKL